MHDERLPLKSSNMSTSGSGSPIEREDLALSPSFATVGDSDVPLLSDGDGMEGHLHLFLIVLVHGNVVGRLPWNSNI